MTVHLKADCVTKEESFENEVSVLQDDEESEHQSQEDSLQSHENPQLDERVNKVGYSPDIRQFSVCVFFSFTFSKGTINKFMYSFLFCRFVMFSTFFRSMNLGIHKSIGLLIFFRSLTFSSRRFLTFS